MDAVTVTVLRGGWWLPGRVLAEGQALTLDAATAEALARRGIVRLEQPEPDVASNAGMPEPKPARRSTRKEAA